MNNYIAILAADYKNTRRDPILLLMLWLPLFMLLIIRYGLPVLVHQLPLLANYYQEIIAFFALLNAVFPGFILSFIILDEKDLQLIPIIKTTPVSLSGFLWVRIGFLVIYGFLSSLILVVFNGVYGIAFLKAMAISILCTLNAPILILLITTLAKNKVEGLTYLKVANIILFIPAIAMFIDTKWELFLGIFPAFWIYQYMDTSNCLYFILGSIVLLGMNYGAYKFALKYLH